MKRLLLLSAALLVASAALAQGTYYRQRSSLFEALPVRSSDIVFVGNSITDGGEWAELFDRHRVLNRGISGDRSSWLLDRLDPIVAGRPKKVFLMIGTNDLAAGLSPRSVVANVARLIDRFAAESPRTKIYVQSVLPVNDRIEGVSWGHWRRKAEIRETNLLLEKLCWRRRNVLFLDLTPVLADGEGLLDKRYTNDGLHLTGEGYLVWRDAVAPYVK